LTREFKVATKSLEVVAKVIALLDTWKTFENCYYTASADAQMNSNFESTDRLRAKIVVMINDIYFIQNKSLKTNFAN